MLEHVVLEEKKKTKASSELVMVKSICRMHHHRMKFCIHGELGGYYQQVVPEAE